MLVSAFAKATAGAGRARYRLRGALAALAASRLEFAAMPDLATRIGSRFEEFRLSISAARVEQLAAYFGLLTKWNKYREFDGCFAGAANG